MSKRPKSPPPVQSPSDARTDDDALLERDDAVIGRAARWSTLIVLMLIPVIALIVMANVKPPAEDDELYDVPLDGPRQRQVLNDVSPPTAPFRDITAGAGIDFIHVNGATGDKLLPETMGGGVAFLDYNNSSHQDLLLINSSEWDSTPDGTPREHASPATMKLYRNNGDGTFVDVTVETGLDISMYGMGVAVGDINNNGWVDIYITALGRNRLLLNRRGYFEDVTDHAGVGGSAGRDNQWSTSAAFVDVNNNGLLDLFVCNYVKWSPDIDFEIDYRLSGIGRAYGPPVNYEGAHCSLYRNNGDGTFTDVSADAGIEVKNPATGMPMAKALAVVPMDFDSDGHIDLFVANDTVRNFLFRNNGDGTFEEIGQQTGAAFDRFGSATGAMGIDAAWYRNDDAIAVAIGNFANEMSSFYVTQEPLDGASSDSAAAGPSAQPPVQFADVAITEGIGPATRLALTFGAFFFDYDLDGRLDYLQANGHIENDINLVQQSQHYQQSAQLFWNAGAVTDVSQPTYIELSRERIGDLAIPVVGRGAAYADIDGDGDLDVIITQIAGPPLLLRNDQGFGHNWLRVKLVGNGETVNRDAIGAVVELTAGGATQRRHVMPTRSYLSQVELPVTFGLGSVDRVDGLRIRWPDGSVQTVAVSAINQQMTVKQSDEHKGGSVSSSSAGG